jgi:hypothetical protein
VLRRVAKRLAALYNKSPETAELLKRIESDGSKHRTEIRDMLARSDSQSFGSS